MTSEARLHQAVWAYHAAVQRRDGVESRLRRGEMDTDLVDRSLTAADAVVEARLTLFKLLIDEGWTPPPNLLQDIQHDDALLRQQSS